MPGSVVLGSGEASGWRASLRQARGVTALGTEFAALGAGAAGGAKGDRFAGEIEIFREVLLANFFFHLIDRCLHLRGSDFGLDIGRAGVAQRALGVPAGRLANPMGAFRSLAEIGLRRLDRLAKSLVVGRSLDGALDFVAVGAG